MLIKLLQINLLESAFAILHCLSKLDIMVPKSNTLMTLFCQRWVKICHILVRFQLRYCALHPQPFVKYGAMPAAGNGRSRSTFLWVGGSNAVNVYINLFRSSLWSIHIGGTSLVVSWKPERSGAKSSRKNSVRTMNISLLIKKWWVQKPLCNISSFIYLILFKTWPSN